MRGMTVERRLELNAGEIFGKMEKKIKAFRNNKKTTVTKLFGKSLKRFTVLQTKEQVIFKLLINRNNMMDEIERIIDMGIKAVMGIAAISLLGFFVTLLVSVNL